MLGFSLSVILPSQSYFEIISNVFAFLPSCRSLISISVSFSSFSRCLVRHAMHHQQTPGHLLSAFLLSQSPITSILIYLPSADFHLRSFPPRSHARYFLSLLSSQLCITNICFIHLYLLFYSHGQALKSILIFLPFSRLLSSPISIPVSCVSFFRWLVIHSMHHQYTFSPPFLSFALKIAH